MPNYHEVQRVLTPTKDAAAYAVQLKSALDDALAEACRNEGHRMRLKGFREEEHIDQATGRKTILVYAQFTPVFADDAAPLAPLNPRDLNDAAAQNGEGGIPRPSQLARGEGIPADQRFGSGEVSDISPDNDGSFDHTIHAGGALPL